MAVDGADVDQKRRRVSRIDQFELGQEALQTIQDGQSRTTPLGQDQSWSRSIHCKLIRNPTIIQTSRTDSERSMLLAVSLYQE